MYNTFYLLTFANSNGIPSLLVFIKVVNTQDSVVMLYT